MVVDLPKGDWLTVIHCINKQISHHSGGERDTDKLSRALKKELMILRNKIWSALEGDK